MTPRPQSLDPQIRAVLEYADDLISDPARWTQGLQARTADGSPVDPTSADAVAFCAVAAIRRAATALSGPSDYSGLCAAAFEALTPLRSAWPYNELATMAINDGPDPEASYQQIRRLFARALGIER